MDDIADPGFTMRISITMLHELACLFRCGEVLRLMVGRTWLSRGPVGFPLFFSFGMCLAKSVTGDWLSTLTSH